MRNIVFRFDSSPTFSCALHEGDQELALPLGERVGDGEWVLTIFEIGGTRRATAAAARGWHRGPAADPVVAFERRDWERLVDFADGGSTGMPAARAALSSEPATERSIFVPPDNVIDAFESGADDSVVKSFRAPELGARIFSRLRRARMAPVHS